MLRSCAIDCDVELKLISEDHFLYVVVLDDSIDNLFYSSEADIRVNHLLYICVLDTYLKWNLIETKPHVFHCTTQVSNNTV